MNARHEDESAHGATGLAVADFDKLAAFIHRVTGIKMPRSKHSMIEGRLRPMVRVNHRQMNFMRLPLNTGKKIVVI